MFRLIRRSTVRPPKNIRREIEPVPRTETIAVERLRRAEENWPDAPDEEIEEAIERWLNPEVVSRSVVTAALHDFEQHWWGTPGTSTGLLRCRCGWAWTGETDGPTLARAMRRHKEDRLAAMLGLTIRRES